MASTRYDRESISPAQGNSRSVLLEIDGRHDDESWTLKSAAQQVNAVGVDPVLTTTATLVSSFKLKDSGISIEAVNESLDILVSAGLVHRHDYPIRNYTLTTEGKSEVETLRSSPVR